jgi:hypothetical protein
MWYNRKISGTKLSPYSDLVKMPYETPTAEKSEDHAEPTHFIDEAVLIANKTRATARMSTNQTIFKKIKMPDGSDYNYIDPNFMERVSKRMSKKYGR